MSCIPSSKLFTRMERGLRNLIAQAPGEEFRGVYVEGSMNPTRGNVLVPGAIGVYTGGGIYNPAQIIRDDSAVHITHELNDRLVKIPNKQYKRFTLAEMRKIIALTQPDNTQSERVWDPVAVAESITQFASLRKQTDGYIYVDRDRGLKEARRETQGILSGGEANKVPDDRL